MIRALALLAALTAAAHADGRTGVVVTGDAKLQAPLNAAIQSWLRAHGRELLDTPLDADAINTLVDCSVIEDFSCARNVIDKRAKSENLVFARVEATTAKKGGKDIAIAAYWFVKGHDAVVERRVCEHCGTDGIKTTTDTILRSLAAAVQKPVTEAEPPPAPPRPEPVPMPSAPPAKPLPVVVKAPPPPPPATHGDRALPIAVGVAGLAAVIIAVPLLMHDDDGSQPTYHDTKGWGVGVGVAGLALIGLDIYLWTRHGKEGPVVAATPHGALVGWTGEF